MVTWRMALTSVHPVIIMRTRTMIRNVHAAMIMLIIIMNIISNIVVQPSASTSTPKLHRAC